MGRLSAPAGADREARGPVALGGSRIDRGEETVAHSTRATRSGARERVDERTCHADAVLVLWIAVVAPR